MVGLAQKGRRQPGTLSPADRQRTIRAMSYAQLARFLRVAKQNCSRRDYTLFLLLADTGVRPGEATTLRWPDIDTMRRRMTVEATKTAERRTVVLTAPLAEALATWQAHGEAEALTAKDRSARTPSEYVFPSRTGQPLTPKTIGREFRRMLRKAELPRFTLYALRHTFASQLLDQSVPIQVVAKLMGHKKPTTTLAFYAHWLPRDDTRYIDRLTAARQAARQAPGDLNGDFVNTKRRGKSKKAGEKW